MKEKGKLYNDNSQLEIINKLKEECYHTIKNKELNTIDVINACDILSKKVRNKNYDEVIIPLLSQLDISYEIFERYISMFEKESLIKKCEIELGKDYNEEILIDNNIKKKITPLGILFHIAAGNVDVLPAYSVIEGLLSRNINILKLPSNDNGLSILLLLELIKIDPKLKDFIYVFDVPSTDIKTIKILSDISDAVVIWGGDLAVKSIKKLASITTKVITFGHKLSFTYATLNALDKDLEDLATQICLSNQLFCSSTQGIFVDTMNKDDLVKFGERFFNILLNINNKQKPLPLGVRGKTTLESYTNDLELKDNKKILFAKSGISVEVLLDSNLTLSNLFRNVWIKPLVKDKLIDNLKPYKNHLQTVCLISNKEERTNIISLLEKTGVTRIVKPENMQRFIIGENHDGMYALREYSKIIDIDIFD